MCEVPTLSSTSRTYLLVQGINRVGSVSYNLMISNLNVYDSIQSPRIKDSTTIEKWFTLIKNSEFSDLITFVRSKNYVKSHLVYRKNKESLPAITYNFNFNSYKKNVNIIGPTGLLYIDIDDFSFDIEILNKTKIFAYYRSYGGKGYTILVKVEGLTLKNYNSTFISICNELGIESYYDNDAAKATQFNTLSFDPNIFINYDSLIFPSINDSPKVTPSTEIEEHKKSIHQCFGQDFNSEIRFNNLNEWKFDGKYDVNWDGFDYICCWLPMRKISKNRNNFLLSYTTNLVYLNSNLNKQGLLKILKLVNAYIFFSPVDENHLLRVINSILKYKSAGNLNPIYFRKKRKMIFAKDSGYTKEEKLKICRDECGKQRITVSKDKIYSVIENWDFLIHGKITVRAVTKVSMMNKKTVEKYWKEFKSFVGELNSVNKNVLLNAEKAGESICLVTDKSIGEIRNIKELDLQYNVIHPQHTAVNESVMIGNYTFTGNIFEVEMEGIDVWENLINELSFNEKLDIEEEILEKYLEKPVNEFNLRINDSSINFFSNDTLEKGFIKISA